MGLTDIGSLDIFDHLEGHYERDWNEISKQENPTAPFDEQSMEKVNVNCKG